MVRRRFNVVFAVLAALWLGWCLYWPFFARNQDLQRAWAEVDQDYRVCLAVQIASASDCLRDRDLSRKRRQQAVAPREENAYQFFAGRNFRAALTFMAALCLLPPLLLYAVARLLLELALYVTRARARSLHLLL
ncbi:MAG: hypothetical protein JO211_05525 [Acidobacteriaceae bacterium]|nr:hypothetical protein [Acidobacteriaceae bacterium]